MASIMRPLQHLIWLMFFLCVTAMIILHMMDLYKSSFVTDKKSFPKVLFKETESMKIASYEAYLLKRGFTDKQIQNMSLLGKWMLAPEGSPPPMNDPKKNYLILIWRYGNYLANRHIKRFSEKTYSPWESCSVQNCILSYEDMDLHRAHAVVFHIQFLSHVSNMPLRNRVDQRWIMLMDESPMYHLSSPQKTSVYDGLFNWTMTYRMNSDVPVPYGRTIEKKTLEAFQYHPQVPKPFWKANMISSKTKLLAVMISHCGAMNRRINYIKKLKLLLQNHLDIIGHCMNGNSTICPHHFTKDCSILSSYKFYLSFENSNCREYITEKVFWNAFRNYAVPIIMGAPLKDCQQLLPPGSYLHVDDFRNANALADYLRYLNRDNERYLKYHEWRVNYTVLNEHGYFGSASKHYCRICEALNYNSNTTKVYKKLYDFWNKERDCIST